MALSLMLRNSCKFQALVSSNIPSSVLRPTVNIVTSKSFTQLSGQNNGHGQEIVLTVKPHLVESQRHMSADHSKLWPIEKAVTLALVGIVPAAIFFPNPILDNIFAVSTVIHFHWGLEACCEDYVRPILLGAFIPKLAKALLFAISAFTLGSLLYYNYTDIGIGRTLQKLWAIKE